MVQEWVSEARGGGARERGGRGGRGGTEPHPFQLRREGWGQQGEQQEAVRGAQKFWDRQHYGSSLTPAPMEIAGARERGGWGG